MIACIFLLKSPKKPQETLTARVRALMLSLDYVGVTLVVGALIMILLVFQDGGLEYSWDSSHISKCFYTAVASKLRFVLVGLLVGFGLSVVAIVVWCWWYGEKAYIRPRIIGNRTVSRLSLKKSRQDSLDQPIQ